MMGEFRIARVGSPPARDLPALVALRRSSLACAPLAHRLSTAFSAHLQRLCTAISALVHSLCTAAATPAAPVASIHAACAVHRSATRTVAGHPAPSQALAQGAAARTPGRWAARGHAAGAAARTRRRSPCRRRGDLGSLVRCPRPCRLAGRVPSRFRVDGGSHGHARGDVSGGFRGRRRRPRRGLRAGRVQDRTAAV